METEKLCCYCGHPWDGEIIEHYTINGNDVEYYVCIECQDAHIDRANWIERAWIELTKGE